MPTQYELEFPIEYVADRLAHAVGGTAPPRAVGWHLSALLKASDELSRGREVDPWDYWCSEEQSDGGEEPLPGLFSMGNLWEAAARPALKDYFQAKFGLMVTGPVQLEREGIIANADALALGQGKIAGIVEMKFRFSADTSATKQDGWMRQAKGYCHMWGTSLVYFGVGNVRQRPPGSGARVYMIQFTEREIEENWALVTNTRDYLERLKAERAVEQAAETGEFDSAFPETPDGWVDDSNPHAAMAEVMGEGQPTPEHSWTDVDLARGLVDHVLGMNPSEPLDPNPEPPQSLTPDPEPDHICTLEWARTSGDFDCDRSKQGLCSHLTGYSTATVWCRECGRIVCAECAVALQRERQAVGVALDGTTGFHNFASERNARQI